MASNMFDLTGQTALITGGNSGLGLAYARGLAKQGANIIIWGRRADRNDAAVREIEDLGVKAFGQTVDVTDDAAVDRGFAEALTRVGKLDCVVQNAGYNKTAPSLAETSNAEWDEQIGVALNGGFYTLRAAARHMTERAAKGDRGGSIILCGSAAVFSGLKGIAHYAAAKGGLASLMRCLALELAPYGIRVNMIAPGLISGTGIEKLDATFEDMIASRTPLGRTGRPEDLEGAAAYLASDAARHHTGDILTIDGGWLHNYLQ